MQYVDEEYRRLVDSILTHTPVEDHLDYSAFLEVDNSLEHQLRHTLDADQIIEEVRFQSVQAEAPTETIEPELPTITFKELASCLSVIQKLDRLMPGKFESSLRLLTSNDVSKQLVPPKQKGIAMYLLKKQE